MLGMRGLLAVAGQRGLSAGTLLIAAGGLTLYQMTSLVLAPAGSHELHLSLAIPAVDADDVFGAATPGGGHTLGMVVAITPAPSPTALRQAPGRPGLRPMPRRCAPAPRSSPKSAPMTRGAACVRRSNGSRWIFAGCAKHRDCTPPSGISRTAKPRGGGSSAAPTSRSGSMSSRRSLCGQ